MNQESTDIEQLRSFQEALRPRDRRDCSHAALTAGFLPAEGPVGGDFHDHLELDEGLQVALVGDVTGHGLPAALVMAVAFGTLREAFRSTRLPCAVMSRLHSLLAELGERAGGPRLFSLSLFLAVLARDGTLQYVNAGHPPGLVLRAGGGVERLAATLPPLGLAEPAQCRSMPQSLGPGDRLVLYSDGLIKPGENITGLIDRVTGLAELESPVLVQTLLIDGALDDRTAMVLTRLGASAEG